MKTLFPLLLALGLTTTLPAAEPAKQASSAITLFDGKSLGDWEKVDIGGSGDVTVEEGEMIIAQGDSVSGAIYNKAKELPLQNYEIAFEAMRVEGSDFFVGLTFPVGDLKTCLTLIMGGWGGALVGISSIDGMDASENNTSSVQKFADNTWYKVKMQVTPKDIHVWLDGKEIINTEIEGHKLGVRPGPIESYLPLSFTTYQTRAAIKNVKLTKLPAAK